MESYLKKKDFQGSQATLFVADPGMMPFVITDE